MYVKTKEEAKTLATLALENFDCTDEEIRRALTTEVVKEIAGADNATTVARILKYIVAQVEGERAERAAAPETLKTADFRCGVCGWEEHNVVISVAADANLSEQKMDCSRPRTHAGDTCGVMSFFWPIGTRVAVFGEENVPKSRLEAAQSGMVRGGVGADFKPFDGTTRSELTKWEKDNNVAPASGDEAKRGNSTVHSKTKLSQTKEFGDVLVAKTKAAEEIVKAGGDRLAEAMQNIERPSDYDVNTAKQQADSAPKNLAAAFEKNRPVDVGEVAAELQAVNE